MLEWKGSARIEALEVCSKARVKQTERNFVMKISLCQNWWPGRRHALNRYSTEWTNLIICFTSVYRFTKRTWYFIFARKTILKLSLLLKFVKECLKYPAELLVMKRLLFSFFHVEQCEIWCSTDICLNTLLSFWLILFSILITWCFN